MQEQDEDACNPDAPLLEAVKSMPRPLFAALDGARFGDAPAFLKASGLHHRSLFLDHADKDVEAAGGWLVCLEDGAETERFIAETDGMGAVVYWSCPMGEAAIYRHLRTLNLVVVPLEQEEKTPQGDSVYADETVMFRHYDPNILAEILPLCDQEQFARIFGPASYILMQGTDGFGIRYAPRPQKLPIAPAGKLHLRLEQMRELKEIKMEASRQKIMDYLREVDPQGTANLSDQKLRSLVLVSEQQGKALGLQSERAQGLWAYLMLDSWGKLENNQAVLEHIRHGEGSTPDDRVYMLVNNLAALPDKKKPFQH